MRWLHDAAYFFGGALLTNAVPHMVSGLMGRLFQTPFAKPPGRGLSSSMVNVFWGSLNLVFGYLFVCRIGLFDLRSTQDAVALGVGCFVTGLMLARTFGPLHGGDRPKAP